MREPTEKIVNTREPPRPSPSPDGARKGEPTEKIIFHAIAERAPVRVRIEARRAPDGVKFWSECDSDGSLDAISGKSEAEAMERVLDRIHAPLGAKA